MDSLTVGLENLMRENVVNRHGSLAHSHSIYNPLSERSLRGWYECSRAVAHLLTAHHIDLAPLRILDLGCGTGDWLRWFAELRGSSDGLTGVDYNAEPLAWARAVSPIEYVQGDMSKIGKLLSNRQFDMLTAFVSFMFLRDLDEVAVVMRQARQLTTKGGYFLIQEVNGKRHEGDYSGYPRAALQATIEAAGYRLLGARGLFKHVFGIRRLNTAWHVYGWNRALLPLIEWLPGTDVQSLLLFQTD